jgi:hypothetical protein
MAADLNLLQMLDMNGDQIQSQFIIRFPNTAFFNALPTIPPGFDAREISLRTQSWTPPETSLAEYEIAVQGLKMKRSSPTEATDKSFSLTVRFDDDWMVYGAFRAWMSYIFNPITGETAPEKSTRTVMHADYYGGGSKPKFRQEYFGVKIATVPSGSYDSAAGDPVTADFRFNYVYMNEIRNPG